MSEQKAPSVRKHTCFPLAGAIVHGDPDMSDEARAALVVVVEAAKRRLVQEMQEQQP